MTARRAVGQHYAGDLRADLLAAAAAVAAEEGPDAVTVRGVAARVGVSHAAPARWFPTRSHLLAAVATEAFRELVADVERAERTAGREPVRRLVAMALAYLDVAVQSPGRFACLWREDLHAAEPGLAAAGEASAQQLRAGVLRAQADGWAIGHDPDVLGTTLWAATHGLATLRRGGPLSDLSTQEFRAHASEVLRLLVAALDG